jgi:pectin methylesterase-like acyl-CoA thioesterase
MPLLLANVSMASCRGVLVITLCLAALQVLFTEPAHCISTIPEYHVGRSSNWAGNYTELKISSSQKLKGILANSGNPLVITVSKNGGQGNFATIQAAIDAVPANNMQPVTINVQPGIYKEKVNIPADKPFITLVGSDAQNTIITWNDSAKSSSGTYYSATVSVYASDFVARDITIENSYGPGAMTADDQAVALRISADRCAFYSCRLLAFQDTVLDESGKHYFQDTYIEGAIDFICGNGKSLYKNCELHAIPVEYGAFTAQKRSSPSEDSGFVFSNCKLTGKGSMFLGRPWGPYSTVIFADTYMDDIIFPEGWIDWPGQQGSERTVTYAEFQSYGPGGAEKGRVSWSREITSSDQIAPYLNINYIDGSGWLK